MPKIGGNLPARVRRHWIGRMHDRAISVAGLNQLRLWIDSEPEVPEGDWYKDFGSFKICGNGSLPKKLFCFAVRSPRVKPNNSLRRLDSDLTFVERERPRLREYIDGLKSEREMARQRIAESEFSLQAAVSEQEAADELRDANASAARVVGRISLYLETVASVDENSDLRGALGKAEAEVRRIELLLSDDAEEEVLTSALNRVGVSMTQSAKDLQLEFSDWPYRFDLNHLTVMADRPGRPIPMQRMGGGKNWLGCHLIAMLSLHRHFVEERRPVPGFLILDQPSQVYFPSLQDYRALSGTTEETVHSDADLDAVQRMFDLLFALCDSLASAVQIIVLEHANLPDGRFQDAVVEPPWTGIGDHALVPETWK